MKSAHFLIPGDPDTRTGGYLYDRRIMAGLAALGWQVELHRLNASFPLPTPAALQEATAALAALPDQALAVVDGLALGAMPAAVAAGNANVRFTGFARTVDNTAHDRNLNILFAARKAFFHFTRNSD